MANLRAPSTRRAAQGPTATVEGLHLRNDDAHRASEPTLVLMTPEGEVVARRTYRLPPGQCRSERDLVPSGTYVVRVRLDGCDDRVACRIGGALGGTARVELGNGDVTVSPGHP